MNVMTKAAVTLIFIFSGLLSFPSSAAPPTSSATTEWNLVTQNSDDTAFYSVKKGSYELATTKNGTNVAMVLGQIENKKDKTFSYSKWYVSTADCDAGIGKLVTLKLNGDFDFDSDFVSKGQNIASGLADFICAVYALDVKISQGKGI